MTLVVPSFRRPDRLAACLGAVSRLLERPAVVIVVHRSDDPATSEVARRHGVRTCAVERPGVLAAMREGAMRARTELIGFLDDDAEPEGEWLGRLLEHFEDPHVGGACGRDRVGPEGTFPPAAVVGRITPWGKLVGNHHCGFGEPREVDVLKGADCLFRRGALLLPADLRGGGAQVHYEVAACLAAKRRGWRMIYDPRARVDHLPGPRFDGDARSGASAEAVVELAFNYDLALLTHRPELWRRRAALGLLIGDRGAPGLARAGVALAMGDWSVAARLVPSLRGQLLGLVAAAVGAGVPMVVLGPAAGETSA